MRLYSINGKLIYKNVHKYKIKWEKPSRSKVQFAFKQFVKPYWVDKICYEEFPVYGSLLKVDFICANNKIAIEIDGLHHEKFNKHFHNNSRLNYLYAIRRDYKKEEWLEKNGFKLARIIETEVRDLSLDWFEEKFGFKLV